ncbi:hypothetical protein PWT90_09116 [Aphanocladium album]|nr:hypothetical protein PWT90_09116 [Aphanocladium album]
MSGPGQTNLDGGPSGTVSQIMPVPTDKTPSTATMSGGNTQPSGPSGFKNELTVSFKSEEVYISSQSSSSADGGGSGGGGDIQVPFTLVNDTVQVMALTWYVDRSMMRVAEAGGLKELAKGSPSDTSGDVSTSKLRPSPQVPRQMPAFQAAVLLPTPVFLTTPERKGKKSIKMLTRRCAMIIDTQTGIERNVILNSQILALRHANDFGRPMVLGVNWTVDGLMGYTYSAAFSIVQSPDKVAMAKQALASSGFRDGKEGSSLDGSHGGTAGPLQPNGSGSSSNNNGTSNLPTVGSGSGSSHSGGGGGLSTGAIVGIAVGVGVAALLAAALGVFFFLRRRRRRRSRSAAALGDQTHAAEQEKLSSFPKDGHANASDPALTPYHDDNVGSRRAHTEDAAAAMDAPLEHPRAQEESDSRAATPQGVSRHLVEDGMTEDEIRRLEEEEAHLDSEIQRAGGRR